MVDVDHLFRTEAEERLFRRWLRAVRAIPPDSLNFAAAYMATRYASERRERSSDSRLFFAAVDLWTEAKAKVEEATEARRKGATHKQLRDPRTAARETIRDEWERWQRREVTYRSDADFGRKMHTRHPGFTSDRSIAQLAGRWRKERRG